MTSGGEWNYLLSPSIFLKKKKKLGRPPATSGRTWKRVCLTSFTGSPPEGLGRRQRLVLDKDKMRYPRPIGRGRNPPRQD